MTDLLVVLMHLAIVIVLAAPIFVIIFISKVSYAPYSLYSPVDLLIINDMFYRPWVFPS
jgi:hypothetical protein